MIGVSLSIDTIEETVVLPVTPRAAINFERQWKIGITKAFADQQKMEHLYWLGWETLRLAGKNPKPFDSWLDTCRKVSFVFEEASLPLDGEKAQQPG